MIDGNVLLWMRDGYAFRWVLDCDVDGLELAISPLQVFARALAVVIFVIFFISNCHMIIIIIIIVIHLFLQDLYKASNALL